MNVTLSISGELEQVVKSHKHIKWTEIARAAMRQEAEKLKKLEILQKYMEKKPLSEEEWRWMDNIDWHPVDEMEYKRQFIEEMKRLEKEPTIKVKNIKKFFEKL